MKIVVAGTRSFNNYKMMCDVLDKMNLSKNDCIISGCAMGADWLGEKYAKEHGLKLERYPAKWGLYGKSAGYIRNQEMGDVCDKGVVFWNGTSRGSKHMIDILHKLDKPCEIVMYTEE